ncbi:COG3904 family protein [Pseudomonas borbori]
MRMTFVAAALLCASLYTTATLAKVEVEAAQHKTLGAVLAVKLSEDIAPGDYEALLDGIKANPGKFARKIALLDSIGGSAPEAIRMGRLLRETGFDTLVPSNGVCQGSCIYLLAAGRKKTVKGHVGLHRPHFPAGESAQAQRLHKTQGYNPTAYFREMNIPPRLAQDMQRIAPHQMRVLTEKELVGYGLK